MNKVKVKNFALPILIMVMLTLIGGCSSQKQQQVTSKSTTESALDFFKGKVITFIVPYDTGGGYDFMARLVAPYMQKYIPGSTITIENVPGAGGMVGTNKLFSAKPDGLTIGILNTMGIISAQVTDNKAVKYDVNKFIWLGRIDSYPNVLIMNHNSPYKSFDDIVNTTKTVKLSSTGAGSSQYVCEKILSQAANLKTQIITGYNSSNECCMAVVRGEVDGAMPPIDTALPLLASKKAVLVLAVARTRLTDYPDVPVATEVTTGEGKKMMGCLTDLLETGRSVALPPGVPEERVTVLRQALEKALKDPEFLEEAKKANRPIEPLSGEDLEKLIKNSMDMPESIKNALKG